MARVLIIADTHCPGMRRGYIDFLKRIADDYAVNRIVHIGDLVDWASISFHEKSPALSNAVKEFQTANDANKTSSPYVVPTPSNEPLPNAAECLDCGEHHVDCSCCPGEG